MYGKKSGGSASSRLGKNGGRDGAKGGGYGGAKGRGKVGPKGKKR